ncbi:AAA family ATPase [Lentzea sp. CA-135723]|uniref:AAA family ATPase n=1 Tax=Lentzea sp. CA-135723 TaxID=3239950 RepID=UPI003D8C6ED9
MMNEQMRQDLEEQLAELQRAHQQTRLLTFEPKTLCWASLLPRWTSALATGIGLADEQNLGQLVRKMVRADLAERRQELGEDELTFWVRDCRLREIGDYLLQTVSATALLNFAHDLNFKLARYKGDDPAPPLWVEVFQHHNDHTGRELMRMVQDHVEQGNLVAADRVAVTARTIGDVLGGPLAEVARRAQWRIDRERRERDDAKRLVTYHRREAVENALVNLVKTDENPESVPRPWVVHLLGPGGVGKTTAIRYLASGRFASDHGLRQFAVARVDFDHLDPRYPEQKRAELVVALADQFVGHIETRSAERKYERLLDGVRELHEELSKSDPLELDVRNLLRRVIRRFARLLQEMPPPVVLVLDTCEELAKLYAPGTRATAIDRTFSLLEQLHEACSNVRVVLAGRRPMVPPGSGRGTAYAGPLLSDRGYVHVVPVTGFSRAEARDYIKSRTADTPLPSEVEGMVLARSSHDGMYNPFTLAGYCDWAIDEPGLRLDAMSKHSDPFVEQRIIGRVSDPAVRAALPAAAMFGRFDHELIRPALERAGADSRAVFDQLSAEEWVTVISTTAEGRPLVIEVDPHLREGLRKATADATDQAQLGRDAALVIAESELISDLPSETIEAAVRLAPAAEAARTWAAIDHRIRREGAWAWATQVTPRVAGSEAERAASSEASILASVLATQASARIHTHQRDGISSLWEQVGSSARDHPSATTSALLADRAVLGRLAAGDDRVATAFSSVAWQRLTTSPGCPDAIVAAIEGALNHQFLPVPHDHLCDMLIAIGRGVPSTLAASALSIAAYLRLLTCQIDEAADLADLAVRIADRAGEDDPWPDWGAPSGLRERARLVRLLIALRGGRYVEPEEYQGWRAEALALRTVDADHLAAATVDYELGHWPIPSERIPDVRPQLLSDRHFAPWLHGRATRPLVVAVADAWATVGQPEVASTLLADHRRAALRAGDHPDLVLACELAQLRLCRRYRDLQWGPVARLAHEGASRIRAEAWLVLRLVTDHRPRDAEEAGGDFAFRRCRGAFGPVPSDVREEWHRVDFHDEQEFRCLTQTSAAAITDIVENITPSAGTGAKGLLSLRVAEIISGTSPKEGYVLLQSAQQRLTATEHQVDARCARLMLEEHYRPSAPLKALKQSRKDTSRRHYRNARPKPKNAGVLHLLMPLATLSGVLLLALWATGLRNVFFALVAVLINTIFGALFLIGDGYRFIAASAVKVTKRDELQLNVEVFRRRSVERPHTVFNTATLASTTVDATRRSFEALTELRVTTRSPSLHNELVTIAIDVPRPIQSIEWEQWLGQRSSLLIRNLMWYRSVPGSRQIVRQADWRERDIVYVGSAYLNKGNAGREAEPRPHRLVHMIGTPVNTTAGVQLRVRDLHHRPAEWRSPPQPVDVDEFVSSGTTLAVFQAEPVDQKPQPLAELRAGFIRLALASLDNGADCALVVPPLPDSMAGEAVSLIRAHMTDLVTPPSSRNLLILLAKLKDLLVEAEEPTSAELPSLDLILFLRQAEHNG